MAGVVLRQKAAVFVRRTKGKLLQREAMFTIAMTKDIRNKKKRKRAAWHERYCVKKELFLQEG